MKPSARNLSCLIICLLAFACAEQPAPAQEVAVETENQKLLYALGLAMGQQLPSLELSSEEIALVQAGLADAALKSEPKVDLQEYGPKLQAFAQQRLEAAAEHEQAASAQFVEEQAALEGAVRTDSGIVIQELTPGTGDSPSATDRVRVHYHGTLRDGSVFDSSVERGQPAEFPLNQVIPCWTEALQTMKVGGKSRIVCPSELAYKNAGRPGIPGGSALVFEIELLDILSAETPGS